MARQKLSRLEILARKINSEYKAVVTSNRQGLDHAHTCGVYLLGAKELAKLEGHVWKVWVDKNCEVGERQERKYRLIAEPENWEIVKEERKRNAALTIDEAVAAIQKSKQEPDPQPQPETQTDTKERKQKTSKPHAQSEPEQPDEDPDEQPDEQPDEDPDENPDENPVYDDADLNEDEAKVLATKMQQHNIKAKLQDMLEFLADVMGMTEAELLPMILEGK